MKKKKTESGFEKRTVHNLIILDESGSMEAIKSATIQGFNELVQTIRGVEKKYPEQSHFVSLVTFNGLGIRTPIFCKRVSELKELDGDSYRPDSMTPLHDAIGLSATKLLKRLEGEKDYNVLVTVLTDGMENASKEYSGLAISQLIDDLKKKGWTFTYIGANHDVEIAALTLSIQNFVQFESTDSGVKNAFDIDKRSRESFARKMRFKEDLQRDYFEDED